MLSCGSHQHKPVRDIPFAVISAQAKYKKQNFSKPDRQGRPRERFRFLVSVRKNQPQSKKRNAILHFVIDGNFSTH
jgi:hypothetical protein